MRSPKCAACRSKNSSMAKLQETRMADGKIKIKLVRSPICTPEKHKKIVQSLGLHKINRVVERPDTPGFRGMVAKVPHLLEIVKE